MSIIQPQNPWNSDTFYSMDESWQRFAKWKKPDTKCQILYDSPYNALYRIEKFVQIEHKLMAGKDWGGITGRNHLMGKRFHFRIMEIF